MDKPSNEHAELIDRYFTGMADDAELAKLNALLQADESLRQSFLAASRFDSHLREQAEQPEQPDQAEHAAIGKEDIRGTQVVRFCRLRSGAIAGLLIGLFSASMVWAYAIPRNVANARTSQDVVFESFEDADMKLSGRFPMEAGQWFGKVRSVPANDAMPAVRGTRVGEMFKGPEPKFSYARYLIDLEDYATPKQDQLRSVEVKASFFPGHAEGASVFQIRLAAFSQEPASVRHIWNDREVLFDTVLQHVGRNKITEPGEPATWHPVRATIPVPPGARSVVISLGAGNADSDQPSSAHQESSAHYVDAVRVRLVDTAEPKD